MGAWPRPCRSDGHVQAPSGTRGLVSLVGAACTAETTEQLDITCEGKCDGLSSVDSLLGDLAQLDVSDLVHQGMAWVPEGFDKGLAATDYLPLRIVPTTFYGKANSAANVVDVAALRSSVLAAFGAGSALDEVLRVRNQQTANGANVFAEMAFRIPAAATPPWMMSARGFGVSTDGELRVGLGGSVTLEGRVVARVPTAAAGLAEKSAESVAHPTRLRFSAKPRRPRRVVTRRRVQHCR